MNSIGNETDTRFTRRAIELAERGRGRVSPNPLVGCIIVSPGGEIAGEGSFIYSEVTHAEIIALKEAGERAKGGTAYVSLEPHSHHGRTPPCTDALIEAGIKRVVCPIEDPNPLVSGRGFAALRAAGVEVVTGVLSDEAERQNEKFICWHRHKRPFVHFKSAITLDGRIATAGGESQWITGEEARNAGRELRYEYDSILVGSNTAVLDDPSLTDRSGRPRDRKLVRIVLDDNLRIDPESNLVLTAKECPVVVFTKGPESDRAKLLANRGVEVVHLDEGARDLPSVLHELARREITSVLVEGGAVVAGSFHDARLIDKYTFFVAPLLIAGTLAPGAIGGEGAAYLADAVRLHDVSVTKRGDDIEITGYPGPNS